MKLREAIESFIKSDNRAELSESIKLIFNEKFSLHPTICNFKKSYENYQLLEASKNGVIVRSMGRPSPANRIFKKDYIAIWIDDGKKYHQAWGIDLGFESNIDDVGIKEDTVSVSSKEAKEFINYMNKEERTNAVLIPDTFK